MPHTSPVRLDDVVQYLDGELRNADIPDYEGALNGLQLTNCGELTRVAAAVDFSLATIDGAIAAGADLLIVHHGMFWSGTRRLIGSAYERMRRPIAGNLAVYSSHIPLDAHPTMGNNVLLAAALGLEPTGPFARYKTLDIGVHGVSDMPTQELVDRARAFADAHGGAIRTTPVAPARRTRRWGMCSGAGANSETLREASALGLDTLIVGEGTHHTAIDAVERDIVVIYAGHYATETLGVQALARALEHRFALPWTFVPVPTGL